MKRKDLSCPWNTLQENSNFSYYSLPALEKNTRIPIQRLPVSIRIILESLLRNCDGKKVQKEDVLRLAKWNARAPCQEDIPFIVSRVILQDFTGVPLLVDLSAMRDAALAEGAKSTIIEPIVPVDLVIDHSVQVDRSGTKDAFLFNLEIEFQRNRERYEFLSWGQQAFQTFRVIPPGIGIVHQINLEHLAQIVSIKKQNTASIAHFDTVVGTDSHTTMVNGLGVLGWGVGGIEAEAAMLGEPCCFQTPEVIGVHLIGSLQEGVTATDLTLAITALLRKEKVVGKFVEFFGEGASSLSVADRASIGNMAPEYGATIGFFPTDEKTLEYFVLTGRNSSQIALIRDYLQAQNLFGIPKKGEIDYSKTVELDISQVRPSVAGPRRPQDLISLEELKSSFETILCKSEAEGGYGKELSKKICVHSEGSFHIQEPHITGGIPSLGEDGLNASLSESEMVSNRPSTPSSINPGYLQHLSCDVLLNHGSIVIAAITSCTNTSNPDLMIAAGILAKKAVTKGLRVNRAVKTSLAPGSRVVTDYLEKAGLQPFLDTLGFHLVAYGCTTCIGNSGPLDESIERAIKEHDLTVASVLSGNRNFEARIHGAVKANFLMSPPLVVAFALAGRINIDFAKEPIGYAHTGEAVFLRDILPSKEEIAEVVNSSLSPQVFCERYANVSKENPVWNAIQIEKSANYTWDPASSYIQKPPFFDNFSLIVPSQKSLQNLRALALFGDSITTDHISPAGAFKASSPAGTYLLEQGVLEDSFNSYGSRRGNHHVMMRGTFANVRLRNQMVSREGGFTRLLPEDKELSIFEASQIYQKRGTSLIIFAGKDYGMGSSRDWAAKGTALLGVRVVVAESFERIHRSNLVGMGVLPLQFPEGISVQSLGITGKEEFSILDFEKPLHPKQEVTLEIRSENTVTRKIPLISRLDTATDIEYYHHGGILPYVLRNILNKEKSSEGSI
jgi:aconitate hydratase